jgi:glycosyltransferase involved in cell wall biosynthesis
MVLVQISVVMTTYNGARWVGDQLHSILTQTRTPDQVIVCDDGSTDGTIERIRGANVPSRVDFRILTGSSAPLGVGANLTRGLRVATGDILALADQDDVWHPDKLARAEATFSERPLLALTFSNATLIDGTGTPMPGTLWDRIYFSAALQREFDEDPVYALLKRRIVTGATVHMRRSLLDDILPFDQIGWHDAWLAIVTAGLGHEILRVDEPQLSYRLHGLNSAGVPAATRIGRLRSRHDDVQRTYVVGRQLLAAADRLEVRGAAPATVARIRRGGEFFIARTTRDWGLLRRSERRRGYVQFGFGWRSEISDALYWTWCWLQRRPSPDALSTQVH